MAIPRTRGGNPLTALPPMKTSPSVGCSSPAIMRSSVVLPQPDGPRRTRNSPSLVAKETWSTAASDAPGYRLVRDSTLTANVMSFRAAHQSLLAPLGEDVLHLFLRVAHRLGRRGLPAGGAGEHVGDHEGVED